MALPGSAIYPGKNLYPSGRASAPWQRWFTAMDTGAEQPMVKERAFAVDSSIKGQFSYGTLYKSFDPAAQAAAGGGTIITGDSYVIAGLVGRLGVTEVTVPA